MSPQDAPEDDAFVRTAIRGMQPPDHHPDFWDGLAGHLDHAEDERRMDAAIGPPGSLDDQPRSRHARRTPPRPAEHAPRRAPLRAAPVAQVAAAATAMDAMEMGPPTEVLPRPAAPPSSVPAEFQVVDDDPFGPVIEPHDEPRDEVRHELEHDAPAPPPRHAAKPANAARPAPKPTPAAGARGALPAHDAPREQVFIPAAAAATTAASLAGRGVRAVADPLAKLTVRHDAATLPRSMKRTSNAVLLGLAALALVIAAVAGLSLVRQRSDSSAPATPGARAEPSAATAGALEQRVRPGSGPVQALPDRLGDLAGDLG